MKKNRLLLGAALLLTGANAAFASSTPGVAPSSYSGAGAPGDSFSVTKTVVTPAIAPRADVFFLADTTGSMGTPIADVRTNAGAVLSAIASGSTDPRFGAGDYKDFQRPTQLDPYAFNRAAPLGTAVAAQTAIGTWSASGGWDGPEGQLFALHEIATNPLVGWRPDSSRFVVWFGDAPGHDPICKAMWGGASDLTTATVASELVASRIKVVAISTGTGYPLGLDDDGALWSTDYTGVCGAPVHSTAQASTLAAATGGTHLRAPTPTSVASTILSGLQNLPVVVTHRTTCAQGLSVALTPASASGTSGDTFTFDESIQVTADAPGGTLRCTVEFLVDGVASPEFTEEVAITVVSQVGTVSAGGPYSVEEGSDVTLTATVADWASPPELAWDLDGDGVYETPGQSVSLHAVEGPAVLAVAVLATGPGGSVASAGSVQVTNAAPVVLVNSPLSGALFAAGVNVPVSAAFSDAGVGDTHTCVLDWGTGSTAGVVTEAAGTGACTAGHAFSAAGVYTLRTTVIDDDGASGMGDTSVVVYDPSAGFVTGGGWISSPAGALTSDPAASGRAHFGFVAKYQKGATVPTGQTEFQFGDVNFHSTAYDWLIVSGNLAQYRGTGSVNGVSGYEFVLTVADGQLTGGDGTDRFRLEIRDPRTSTLVYDNQPGAAPTAAPQAITVGSIVIHE